MVLISCHLYFYCINHEHFYELLTVQLKKKPDEFRISEGGKLAVFGGIQGEKKTILQYRI